MKKLRLSQLEIDSLLETIPKIWKKNIPAFREWTGPVSYQAVDLIIYHQETDSFLLGKKAKEPLFRFIGGFVEPSDASLEAAAKREKVEEVGVSLECSEPKYEFSFRVDDPRYRDSRHKIMSAVFSTRVLWGEPKAGDDIHEVKYFARKDLHKYKIFLMPEHHFIARKFSF